MAKGKRAEMEDTREEVAAEDFWAGANELPEGFEEVERQSAKRLEPGEQVVGQLKGIEKRQGLNPNTGEESDYMVYILHLEDGTVRAVGGAPVLDSLVTSGGGTSLIGRRVLMARAVKNGKGKTGRSGPGMYRFAVAGMTNGKAKA